MDQLDPQLRQAPLKLTVRLPPGQLLVHRRLGRRFVGRMLVRVDGQGEAIPPHIASEALQGGHRAFILVEPGPHPTGGIVDIGQQDAAGAAPLEPVMVRAVQLHQFAHVGLARPPRPMRALAPPEVLHPLRQEPAPQRLRAHRDPVPLGQLLRRQRRPEIPIPLRIEPEDLRLDRLSNPPVRRLAPPAMHQPPVPLTPDPLHQTPDVPCRQLQQPTRLHLGDPLLHRLADHMHPPKLLSTHDDPALSDHPALLSRASSLLAKRTFLYW